MDDYKIIGCCAAIHDGPHQVTQPQAQCAALHVPELLEEGRLKVREQQHALTARAGARRAPEAVNVRLAVGETDLQDERNAGVVNACGAR